MKTIISQWMEETSAAPSGVREGHLRAALQRRRPREFEKFNMSAMRKKLRSVGHDDREISEWKKRTAARKKALRSDTASAVVQMSPTR
jgi:hypothetical protein